MISWQPMIWTTAQAGDRVSKSGCFLQWRDQQAECLARLPAVSKVWHSSLFLLKIEPGNPAQEKEVWPTKPALMPPLQIGHSATLRSICWSCSKPAHRSHFGSRYTKGHCTCAGLIVDFFPKRHKPCLTARKISYGVVSLSELETPGWRQL